MNQSSNNLLRELLQAAIAADLTKNEWSVFAVMLSQTLGYGKRNDALTTKRIAKLAEVRKDRAEIAIAGVIKKGMFEQSPHKLFDYAYALPARFLADDAPTRFFAPTLPKIGNDFRNSEDFSENRIHTEYLPLQNKLNNTDKPSVAVGENKFVEEQEIIQPNNVPDQAMQDLFPALVSLPVTQANDVLKLLAQAIKNGSIKTTPTKFGGALIKMARQGALDTSTLHETTDETANRYRQIQQHMDDLKRDANAITALYQRANVPIPPSEQQKIAAGAAKYQALKAELQAIAKANTTIQGVTA